jgi:hypothetical protein
MRGSLIDSGANGGWAGDDVRWLVSHPVDRATVSGIAGRSVENLRIATVAGYIESTTGPIIGIFNQYAYYGKGKSIHSVMQMKHFGLNIDDDSKFLGGEQRIVTKDGFVIPLHVRDGLIYMDMRKPTDNEMSTFRHVAFTSAEHWDPSVYDSDSNLRLQSTVTMATVNMLPRYTQTVRSSKDESASTIKNIPARTRILHIPHCMSGYC